MAKVTAPTITIPYRPRPYQAEIHRELDAHRFAVLVMHRRSGKTVLAVNQLIKRGAQCPLDRPRLAYIAPLFTQAKKVAWDYLKHFTLPIPGSRRNESELMVELPNGARVQLFGADNPDALRGIYLDGVVIDEPADMKLSHLWAEVIRPTLADRGGWAVFTGTPRGLDPFYELYQMGMAQPEWYTTLRTVDDTGAISPEELALARAAMSEAQFRQEFYCDFTASRDDVFIPLSIVQPAQGRYRDPSTLAGAPVVLGYDFARFGDDESVGMKRQGLAAWMIRAMRHVDTMTMAGHVVQDIVNHEPAAVFIDEGVPGEAVIDRLRQLGYGRLVIPVSFGSASSTPHYRNKRAEMWGAMKQWLIDGGAIPPDPRLAMQISAPLYDFDEANRVRLEKKADMKDKRGLPSPDRADALAVTFAHPVAVQVRRDHPLVKVAAAQRQRKPYSMLDYR